jgi:hypothetical protein
LIYRVNCFVRQIKRRQLGTAQALQDSIELFRRFQIVLDFAGKQQIISRYLPGIVLYFRHAR